MRRRYYYDLHTHSCLSPCADNDNTPNNLLGMAHLAGINILALTDHNSTKNCPAFFEASKKYGIIPIAGMELTTSEDIHVVCLFKNLESAIQFDSFLDSHRMRVKNKPDVFGNQLILDGEDNLIGQIDDLLSVATDISVDDVYGLVKKYDGVAYPAHIDRESNGIIATLGAYPKHLEFGAVEFRDTENVKQYVNRFHIEDKKVVISSDAHYLTGIKDKENYFEFDSDSDDFSYITDSLIEFLR